MRAFYTIFYIIIVFVVFVEASNIDGSDATIVVISQDNAVSNEKVSWLEKHLQAAVKNPPLVVVSHKHFDHVGDWTILPIVSQLATLIQTPWVVFLTEDTSVDLKQLLIVLSMYNSSHDIYVGHALYDTSSTIIHHFSSKFQFPYPLMIAGFAMSYSLLNKLNKSLGKVDSDFSIDAAYELALYISEQANGTLLTNSGRFCIKPSLGCATWVSVQASHPPVPMSSIIFAVKTCGQFHNERVPVVKATWGQDAKHIMYFSDTLDDSIPTTVVNVENVARGHCTKTREMILMLRHKFSKNSNLHWAVIADDDTILSVRRVQEVLGSYNHSELVGIGERYGYNVGQYGGYNYLTGGGGVILSRALLLEFGKNTCSCPSLVTPDDMFLFGVCFKRMHWTIIHSPLFHQARPNDYSNDYLAIGKPVSFHKHWNIAPIDVYHEWFHHDHHYIHQHEEL